MGEQNVEPVTLSEREIVSFRLAERTYALPLSAVVQIIPMVAFTPLPQAHKAVEGIMNYRGNAALVVNLRRYLDLSEIPLKLHTPIILTRVESRLLGLIVDEVLDVITVPVSQAISLTDIVPEGLGSISALEGVLHNRQDAILLLDLARLFAGTPLTLLPDTMGNGSDPHPSPVTEMALEEVF
ncbi:MAG: purine-binding chemotaxis protein CheW [Anaerolineae bacterium]|nr:purine-binding chemotaxis protein CheW [Anaerolineae bacterium]